MKVLIDTHIAIWAVLNDPKLPEPVFNKHVLALETLKRSQNAPQHKDPFDRIMLAQAKEENLMFLTHDSLISYYGEPFVISV